MEHESQGKKCCIAIGSIVHLVFAGCVGLVYCLWWKNVDDIQSLVAPDDCKGKGALSTCATLTVYNVYPLVYYAQELKDANLNYFSDWA